MWIEISEMTTTNVGKISFYVNVVFTLCLKISFCLA